MKTPEEVDAIRASVRVAERSLGEAEAALAPGVTERQLTGVFMEAMASDGVTTPATQDVAWITSRQHPWHRASRDVAVEPGDLVAFDAGVISGGYSGELGRTHLVGGDVAIDRALSRSWDELWDRLLAACRLGAPLTELLDAYAAAGVPPPPMPVARGLGLGFDLPLVTHALPGTAGDQHVEEGMVLALSAYVWKEGVGALYGQEPVVITATGPEPLSTNPFRDREELRDVTETDIPPPEEIILYEKDPSTRIATITLNRPDQLNIPTIAARRRYADLLFKASIDDDVKVLVVRGIGDHLGTGADLDELMAKQAAGVALQEEFGLEDDDDVTMPGARSVTAPGHRSFIGTATRDRVAVPFRTSRRSASSRSRATATAGTSIRPPMRTL